MRNCIECNHRFSFFDRLKSFFSIKGYLRCPECNSSYKPKVTWYRWIYVFLAFYITFGLFNIIELHSFILECILYALIVTPIIFLFDAIPHKGQKYTKVN